MPGPGRHFYSPFEYETKVVPDLVIEPGMLGLVTASVGKEPPAGAMLADEGYRGIRRRVLTPGRYRINPYAYKVETVDVARCVGSEGGVRRRQGDATLIPRRLRRRRHGQGGRPGARRRGSRPTSSSRACTS